MLGRTLARNVAVAYRPAVRVCFACLLTLALASPVAAQDTSSDDAIEARADGAPSEKTPTGEDHPAEDQAAQVITTTPTPAPKIALVVAGDPDETIRETAGEIEAECVEAGLEVPSDPALRAALRGAEPTGEDGLEGLRALRRSLGIDPRKDLMSYKRIGTIVGADALVVLHREGTTQLEVFDVSASQFYEGMLEVEPASSETRVAYIELRAKTAQQRWNAEEPVPEPAPDGEAAAGAPPEDEPEKKRWIKKAWPYFLVGALLIGGVTYIIVDQRRDDDPGPPLLRFRPGDE